LFQETTFETGHSFLFQLGMVKKVPSQAGMTVFLTLKQMKQMKQCFSKK
jgi:hypothetical protein